MSHLQRNWGSVDVVMTKVNHCMVLRTESKWWSWVVSIYRASFKKVQLLILPHLYGFSLLTSGIFSVFSRLLLTHTYHSDWFYLFS